MNPFSAIFVPDELTEALSDRAWLAAMLAAESALAAAQAQDGTIDPVAAAAVVAACDPARYDVAALAEQGRSSGNPVVPLVHALREQIGEPHAAAAHRGATSQDILDTASMLVSRDALRFVDSALGRIADSCAQLADEHRGTVIAARTLLQQAVPTTFGAKAAGWLVGALDAREAVQACAGRLPAQLGGAAGTLAAFGENGIEVLQAYAASLELREPDVPWHTIRTPVAELAGALATTAGVAGKIARDIVLLAQTEVAEVSEGDGGESSTMPHKANPTAAVLAAACERHARASCGVLFESVVAEHERAAGAWHAEWHALTTALAATGGAVDATARSLAGLRIDAERMRANVSEATLSEARSLGLAAERPEDYLGSADAFVERALARYRA
ncbi:MAG TPA: 3-carboxy-cis,cis-muconate cycloisomerase [Gaiellaceae bacterium]|nr:3-carboxy-cis,cis-muconate cycloisomerase [Gaiellaceae bacterium]